MSVKSIKRAESLFKEMGKLCAQTTLLRFNYGDILTPEENIKLEQYDKDLEAIRLRAVGYFNKVLHL